MYLGRLLAVCGACHSSPSQREGDVFGSNSPCTLKVWSIECGFIVCVHKNKALNHVSHNLGF